MATVEYLEFNGAVLIRVGCMKCNATIGKVNPKTEKFVYWTNYRHLPLTLADGSYQNILLCKDCFSGSSDLDPEMFDGTRKWGWEQDFKSKGIEEKVAKKMVDDFSRSKKIIGKLRAK